MCRNRKGLAVGCLIVISLVSAFIALVLSIVDVRNVYQPSPDKYGIVFDAGSSHTSLYVYRWPADKENDTGIVSQVHACHVTGPGLSGYADRPDQAGASLKPCMDEALAIIPKSQHAETTTLLGATAGMRLLNLQNETLTQTIFTEVSKTLRTFPVRFQGARILTGNEEGSLGWITVNYLLGTFVTHSLMNIWIHPGSQILGAMDLGGASTQMTFLPSGVIEDKSTEMSFRLYGYNYTIYTHSYLCYGQDQIFKRILAKLIQNKGNDLENVTHPCYPKGYTGSVSLSSLDSPCISQIPGDPVRNVTMRGTGDPDLCLTAVRDIMNFTACNKSSCSFDGVYQPPVQGEFYAFSAFYYTLSFLNLTSGQSLEATNRSVRAFCSEEWSKLIGAFPSESQTRLSQYCSSAAYILTLLTDGYRFTDRTWNNIHFAKQIGDAEVGWTLGYMLNLTNMIPSEAPGQLKGQRYSFWVASLFFIALSLAAGLVAAPLHCFRRNTCAGQGGWS